VNCYWLCIAEYTEFSARLQNGSATAIDNIFIDASLQGNYIIYVLINGLCDHDVQLIVLTEAKAFTKNVSVKKINKEN
jgi:hypothetical protein